MTNNHFIYTHTSPSGKVYVGQTVNYKRRWGYNGEHYKNKKADGSYIQGAFARAIDKYGWGNFEHKIILENISKSEADYAEKYLIKWYKLHNLSYNITEGGEGTCGPHPPLSAERKEKLLVFLHTNPPMKGRHHTEEAKRKISKAFKGRKLSEERRRQMSEISRGRKHSDESKIKMSEYRKAHPETWIGGWNKIEVYQYDLEGNYIASYPSAVEAASALNKSISGDISSCIQGHKLSAGGYLWKSEKVDHIDMSNYRVLITPKGARVYDVTKEGILKRSAAHGKAVNQYSVNGDYVASYTSASEAAAKMGFNRSGIMKCCKQLPKYKTASGFVWRYDTGDNRKNINVN